MVKNELHKYKYKALNKNYRPAHRKSFQQETRQKKTVFKPLNSDGTNYYMSGLYTRLYMKNTINMWNRKLIWISQVVVINFLMD